METNENIRPVIVGRFSPPMLASIRSWERLGYKVGMVCVTSEKDEIPQSLLTLNMITLPQEKLFKAEGLDVVRDFLEIFSGSAILSIDEKISCWFNDNRKHLTHGTAVCATENDIYSEVLSKKKQIEVARNVGLNILPTYIIDGTRETIDAVPDIDFPLCLRPEDPTKVYPTFKVYVAPDPKMAKEFINGFQRIEKPIIAQPFKNFPNLVVHGARTKAGETIGMAAFIVERKFEGVTLTIRPYSLDNELRKKCIAFTDEFGLTGNYHFEFLIDPKTNETYFLEINNRLGGTTAKVFACGYDEPLYALKAYGVEVESRRRIRNVTVSSKQALLKYLYYTLRNRLTPLDYPADEPKVLRILRTLWGLFLYKDDVFSFNDLRGSMALYMGNLRGKMRKARRLESWETSKLGGVKAEILR